MVTLKFIFLRNFASFFLRRGEAQIPFDFLKKFGSKNKGVSDYIMTSSNYVTNSG